MDKTPRGNEILDFDPGNLPANLLTALGYLSACASNCEGVIQLAIAGMLGIDGEKGWAITSHMTAPLRASVLKSSAEIAIQDGQVLDELDTLLAAIKTASEGRNKIVHGEFCVKRSTGELFLKELGCSDNLIT